MQIALGEEASSIVLALQPLKRFTVQGRTGRKIVIVRAADGTLAACDFHCFHHGQALGDGVLADIEELGTTALKCPAHGYVIDCKTGERLIRDESDGRTPCWRRLGVVQRTHKVIVDERSPSRQVSIILSDSSASIASDAYNLPAAAAANGAACGGGASTIAFACRKSRATQAVARAHGVSASRAVATACSAHPTSSAMSFNVGSPPPPAPTFASFPATPTPSVTSAAASPASPRPTSVLRQSTLDGMFAGAAARRAVAATPQPPAMPPTPLPPPESRDGALYDAMDTS